MPIANKLQDSRNQQKRLAEVLTAKGVPAAATEKYDSLVDKVTQIEELRGEERTLTNVTSALSEPKSIVQLEYPEPKNLFDVGTVNDYYVNPNAVINFTISDNVLSGVVADSSTSYIYNTKLRFTSGTYTFSSTSSVSVYRYLIRAYDTSGNILTTANLISGWTYNNYYNGYFAQTNNSSATIPETVSYWQAGFAFAGSGHTGETVTYSNIQIEKGSTATSYEPYPAPKTLNAKLSSVNLFDETTLLSVDHTEDDEAYIFQAGVLFKTKNLTPNVTFKEKTRYTLKYIAKQAPNTGSTALPYPRLQIYYTDGTSDLAQTTTEYKTIIVQSNANKTIDHIGSGYSTAGLFYIQKNSIQLIEGAQSKLGTYTPYISDFSTVNVTRCGKNLTTPQQVYKGASLYSEEVFENKNCVRFSSGLTIKNSPIIFKPNTRYTVSFDVKTVLRSSLTTSGADCVFSFFYEDGTHSSITNIYTITDWAHKVLTSTEGKTVVAVGLYTTEYRSYSYVDIDSFQLEENPVATPYEPYQGQTYTPTTTGEVTGITNLYPTTTLLTNNAGVLFTSVLQGTQGNEFTEILPSSGKNGITKINQPIIDSSVDDNIKPENIKKGVKILGILGTYDEGLTTQEALDAQATEIALSGGE